MPTASSILLDLKAKGKEKTRSMYSRHGMSSDRVFGVSVADLKAIAKTIRGQQSLACDLYETGNMDAMYLAGIVADGSALSAERLSRWLANAEGLPMIVEHTIPWLAVENPQGRELALAWIKSDREHIAAAGWATYSGLLATQPDAALDLAEVRSLLDLIVRQIATAPNRVRVVMNTFVISVGIYVTPMLQQARTAAAQIGKVNVDVGDTACVIPLALAYIEKNESMGRLGKKRRTIRC